MDKEVASLRLPVIFQRCPLPCLTGPQKDSHWAVVETESGSKTEFDTGGVTDDTSLLSQQVAIEHGN